VAGAKKALAVQAGAEVAIVLGMVSAVGGRVLRDRFTTVGDCLPLTMILTTTQAVVISPGSHWAPLLYDDSRLLPQAFTGTLVTSKEIEGLELNAGRFTADSPMGDPARDPNHLKSIDVIGGTYRVTDALSVAAYHSLKDEQSWQLSYELDFAEFGVPGLTYKTAYVRGSNIDAGGEQDGTERQFFNQVKFWMAFSACQTASLPMLTEPDQLIDHIPDLRSQVRHLRPHGMHIDSFGFIPLQNLHQPARLDIVLEKAAWHLAQTCAGDRRENHGFPIANLMSRRWRVTYGLPCLHDPPRQRLAASMPDNATVLAEVFQGLWDAEAHQIVRGGTNDPALSGQAPRHQTAGVLQFSKANQQINALLEGINQVIGERQVQLQSRVLIGDLEQQWGHDPTPECHGNIDTQASRGLTTTGTQPALCGPNFFKGSRARHEIRLTIRGQGNAPRRAMKQLCAQAFFQARNGFANSRF
jgi:hypothetical protein